MSFLHRERVILEIMLYCKIKPLQRPRFNKRTGGVYQPKENQKELLSEMGLYRMDQPVDVPIVIDTAISFEKRKKHMWPVIASYGDEDNLRKAINDALQDCGVIGDDKLVVGGENIKFFGGEDYCYIKIWEAKLATSRLPKDCG